MTPAELRCDLRLAELRYQRDKHRAKATYHGAKAIGYLVGAVPSTSAEQAAAAASCDAERAAHHARKVLRLQNSILREVARS